MTATLILVLLGLAFLHFIWDGIIAPSYRMRLRYELFALRDELIEECVEERADEETFEAVQESINGAIALLPYAGITLMLYVKMARHDPEFQAEVTRRRELFARCTNERIHRIRRNAFYVGNRAIAINLGAWWLVLSPVIILMFCFEVFRDFVDTVMALPEAAVARFRDNNDGHSGDGYFCPA